MTITGANIVRIFEVLRRQQNIKVVVKIADDALGGTTIGSLLSTLSL